MRYYQARMVGLLVVLLLSFAYSQPALGQTSQPADWSAPTGIERRILIQTSQDKLWDALCKQEVASRWFPNPLMEVDLQVGGKLVYGDPEAPVLVCEVLEVRPKDRLVVSFSLKQPYSFADEPPSRVTYELTALGPCCQLHLVHDQLENSPKLAGASGSVWDSNLSQLKTLLETGKPLMLTWGEDTRGPIEPLPEKPNPLAYVKMITLYVSDLKAVRPWYEETFDLPLMGFSLDWIKLWMGSPMIEIHQADARSGARPGQVGLSFRAEDVEGLFNRLKTQGVSFRQSLTKLKYFQEFRFESPDGTFLFHVTGPLEAPGGVMPAPATRPAGAK